MPTGPTSAHYMVNAKRRIWCTVAGSQLPTINKTTLASHRPPLNKDTPTTRHPSSMQTRPTAPPSRPSSGSWKTKTRLTPWTGQSSVWLHPTVERWGCATSACLRRPASPSPTPRRPSTRETKLFQNAAIVTRCSWNIGSFFHSLIFTSTNSNSFLSLIFNLTLTYRVTVFKFPI